jgi:putative ABC transport system permease protein
MRAASPGYFHTLGIPLTAGRAFRDDDNEDAEGVAVVSVSLARSRWPNQDPVGRRVTFDLGKTWTRIVGVVGDVKETSLSDPAPDQFYRPLAQVPGSGRSLLVRAAGNFTSVAEQVRLVIHDLDPQMAITYEKSLDEARTDAEASPRTVARVFGLFAALAFLIAIAGITSMLALWVRQRTRELGIRMALGASPREIVVSLLRQGMTLVALGAAAGIAGAMALTGLLKGLLFEVTPADPETYATVSVLLLVAALAACWAPARRAARIDPQQALRCE